ncbi:MAG TPA: DUF2064 domain-containing protein [Candidatus Eremiobacteraceae bacterium]|nr:DUF2064 domain-containing protein [Candidatus Eremiobacteraceae bacterium]
MTIGKRQAVLAIVAEHPDRRTPSALQTEIGRAADARFARAVIGDLAERFGRPEAACSLLWCVPADAASDFTTLTSGAGDVADIAGGTIGARWDHAARAAFARGFTHVAVMGLDAPHVPADVVYGALGQVDQYGLAFGAGDRDTIYVAAVNKPTPIFVDVAFEGDHAATDLVVAAAQRGLSCAPLVGNFSVRTADDLRRLAEYLDRHVRVAAPRTRAVVAELIANRADAKT